MELNFFDTNPAVTIFCLPLGILLEEMPIRDRNLYVSVCIEVLENENRTEPVVVVTVAMSDVRLEHTCFVPIIAITATFNERPSRYSLIPSFFILYHISRILINHLLKFVPIKGI